MISVYIYGIISTWVIINVFAYFDGVRDAILWSKMGAEAFDWNEHIVFVVQRGILLAAIINVVLVVTNMYTQGFNPDYSVFILLGYVLVLVSSILSFSFIHNGAYYISRKQIDNKLDYNWKSDSTSSTAKLEISYKERLLMFFASILVEGFAIYLIYLI